MAQIIQFHLAHTPPSISIYGALFTNIKNAAFLRQQLLAGNTDFEYAFIDARMIISLTHVLASVFRSINDLLYDRLKSRNVHSEIVFNLSPTNNIADSFRRFGVTESTTDLLAIKIGLAPDAEGQIAAPTVTLESVTEHLSVNVEGASVPLTDESLAQMADVAAISKVYKLGLTQVTGGKFRKKGDAVNELSIGQSPKGSAGEISRAERRDMDTAILAMMALKGS